MTKAELLALTWRDIDFENSSIQIYKAVAKSKGQMILKVPKNKSSVRTLMLPQQVMDMLRQLKQEQREYVLKIGSAWKGKRGKEYDYNFLFTQWDGSLIYPTTPYSDFKKLIRNYNKTAPANAQLPDITLHDLRHPYVKPTTKNKLAAKAEIPNYQHEFDSLRFLLFCLDVQVAHDKQKPYSSNVTYVS